MLLKELTGLWLDSARKRLRESTAVSYRIAANKADKYLGGKEIRDITEADLEAVEKTLAGSGDSYQTSRLMFNVVRLSLDYAVEEGWLPVNPAKRYTPRKELYRSTKKTKAATAGDVKSLLEKYRFLHPYHMPITLLYEAGLRSGEMLGLTWEYVDFKESAVHVVRQLVKGRADGKYKFAPLRSQHLVRSVIVDKKLREQLARWKQDQEERGLLRKKDSFVCVETDGSPIRYHQFVYTMRKEGFTPQSIRRAYEDGANETAAILKERLSMEEIRDLQEAALSPAGLAAYFSGYQGMCP